MIAHTGILVSDYQRSKEFYTRLLKTLGYSQNMEYGESAGFNDGKNTDFWVNRDAEKGMAKMHVAFEAKSRDEVDAFYKEALEAGGSDNGAPGYRTDYWPGYYAAFIRDPDGHNIEVVWYDYSKVEKN
jgi:catechol 2,3-dioxygenase-like lactoylglutathione lyase family enzyme